MTASDNRFLKDFYSSVVFLTRFPAPPWVEAAKRPLATSMWAFPIVGVLIAAVGSATYVCCDLLGLPVFIAALFTVVTIIIATGGLHEDGLSDLADGVWGGADPRQRLSIMSDSRIGAHGTIALITSVGSRTAAIAAISDPMLVLGALVATCAVSRGMMPIIMMVSRPAKEDGLGASAGTPAKSTCAVSLLLAFTITMLSAPGGWLICMIAAAMGTLLVSWLAQRALGGYTGDTIGASQQLAEMFALAIIASALVSA